MPWGPNTPQDTRDFLDRAAETARAEPRLGYELGVVTKTDGRLLGAVGLRLEAQGCQAMLGYCYHADAWGHGYATEAAEALLRFGFDVLLLHRIWAGCDPDNTASARVLEKLGLTLEGHLREDTRIRGEFRDSLIFGMLDREWALSEEDG
jgi:RimJ/RimL family protein N-acetyltransferase